jgi:predicted RNA binding protein YcfA (HicA-like mRNA interferase family)
VSDWPASKARLVLSALLRLGWTIKRTTGSHRVLARDGWPDFVFAFHDGDEIGPACWRVSRGGQGLRPMTCSLGANPPVAQRTVHGHC